jgi:hypothetical protein
MRFVYGLMTSILMLWLFPVSAQIELSVCTSPMAGVQAEIETLVDEYQDNEDVYRLIDAPEWEAIFTSFTISIQHFLNTCLDSGLTLDKQADILEGLSFITELDETSDLLAGTQQQFVASTQLIDVNLDEVDELIAHVRYGYPDSPTHFRVITLLFYIEDGDWEYQLLAPPTETTGEIIPEEAVEWVRPRSYTVFPQADTLGRTYMGIRLYALPTDDPYTDAYLVIRWQQWETEIVLFARDVCVITPYGDPWMIGDRGELIIPTTSSVPNQGCTVVRESQLVIPDAQMTRR